MDTPVAFLSCFTMNLPVSHIMRWHQHDDCHELVLILRGELQTRIGEQLLQGSAGSVLFYPQGLVHAPRTGSIEPLQVRILRWRGLEHLIDPIGPAVHFDRDERIFHQTRWILALHPSDNPDEQAVLQSLCHAAVHEWCRLKDPTPSSLVERTRRYVHEHLADPISLDDLAACAGLSKYHYVRTFKKHTGQTPMHLLGRMRLEAARVLIQDSDLTLEAIAYQVGLSSASHLSHLFRRLCGYPPGVLRRR
jgi:AraC-like DNA-binding protein